jgi:hypothetical protein
MKRTIGLLALTGAGIAYLMCTDRGRSLMQQAKTTAQDTYEKLSDRIMNRSGVDSIVEDALAQPHEDTAVARALEEAIA